MAYVRFLGRRECTRSLSVTCYSVGFCRSTQIIASENYGALWHTYQHTCYSPASGVRVGKSGVHDVEGGLERPRTPGGDRGGSPGPTTALSVTCLLIDRWGRWVAGSTNSLSSLCPAPPLCRHYSLQFGTLLVVNKGFTFISRRAGDFIYF